MKKYLEVENEYGAPREAIPSKELFLPEQRERAEKILRAVEGMRVCTALALLQRCEKALLQSTVDVD